MEKNKAKRPTTVLVAAILLIIFGSWSILGGCCIAVIPALGSMVPPPPPPPQPDIFQGLRVFEVIGKEVPSYVPFVISMAAISLLLGVGAVIAGINSIRLKSSGRRIGMAVALANIAMGFVSSIYNVLVVFPVTNVIQAKRMQALPQGQEIAAATNWGALIFGLLFSLAIWLTIFFLLNSKTSRDAFAGITVKTSHEPLRESGRQSRHDDYDDENDAGPPETGYTDRPPR